jgi:hypothetical protein
MPIVQVPGSSIHITFHGQGNIADVIKLRNLRWGMVLDYLAGPNVMNSPSKREGGSELEVVDVKTEAGGLRTALALAHTEGRRQGGNGRGGKSSAWGAGGA